jgi:hypothetical protein
MTTEKLLTYAQTAELWQCHPRTVVRKVQAGEIEIVQLSEHMPRIKESVAAEYVASKTRKAGA